MYKQDTIAAIATPPGIGAIAIIRVSGFDLLNIYTQLTKKKSFKNRRASYLPVFGHNGEVLDTCMVIYMKGPNSYTGEDIIEVNCHGGNLMPKIILSFILSFDNVRMAESGEFSRRAFLNGRIDLTQAESISALIQSKSEIIQKINLKNSLGFISDKIHIIYNNLSELLVVIEHELDFNENEVEHTTLSLISNKLTSIHEELNNMLKSSLFTNKLSDGFVVVICGKPNVGKSSLFNVLVGKNRVIVSDQIGTTRDSIEIPVDINGTKIRLVDTAGYIETSDYINNESVKQALHEIKRADILLLLDDINPENKLKQLSTNNKNVILVQTKQDLITSSEVDCGEYIKISSKKAIGVDILIDMLSTMLSTRVPVDYQNNPIITSRRQSSLINNALLKISDIIVSLDHNIDMVIVSSQIRFVTDLLSELIGKIYNEDILDNIFNDFCVGK